MEEEKKGKILIGKLEWKMREKKGNNWYWNGTDRTNEGEILKKWQQKKKLIITKRK